MEAIVAFDFDLELSKAIAEAAARYGAADPAFTRCPVVYHEKSYAQSIVDEKARTISVKLADPTPFRARNRDIEARYELWHEAVHCLAPVNRMDTLWFEEGLAINFALRHSPLTAIQRAANMKALRSPWKEVWIAFTKLDAPDEKIALIHERAEHRRFDSIKEQLIVEIFGAPADLAEQLCQRLSATGR
jgi:hypothetical protein